MLCDKKERPLGLNSNPCSDCINASRAKNGFYQVKVDDEVMEDLKTASLTDQDTIGQIKTRDIPIGETLTNAPIFQTKSSIEAQPIFQFDRMDHFIASNLKYFITESYNFHKGLKEGSIILSEQILEQFLRTLISNCKFIEFIITDNADESGCCGYSMSGPKDLKIYINKREFRKNYEDVFNRLMIDYSFDLEHVL